MPTVVQPKFKRTALASAVSLALASAPLCMPAHAQEGKEGVPIAITARPLGDSLVELARQTGIRIIAPGELVNGKQAPALNGNFTTEDAIQTILEDTGLELVPSADGTLILRKVALASEAAPVAEQASNSPAFVDEIIVRGRFQQSVIDRIPIGPKELPFSLDVLDRDYIDLRNFVTPSDVLTLAPNVDIRYDFVGLGFSDFNVRGYEADVLINNRLQTRFGGRDDSFVERYEVLKGPASIALGPTLPGGVINTVTKNPEAESFSDFELSTDQFGTIDAEFDFNTGSLGPNGAVRARISGAYRDFEFDANETERKIVAVRPVVEVDITERTTVQASASITSAESVPNLSFPLYSDGSVPDGFDTDVFFGFERSNLDFDDVFFDAQLNHEFLDNLELTLRGSYQEGENEDAFTRGAYNYLYEDNGLPGASRTNPVAYAYPFTVENDSENVFFDAQLAGNIEAWGQRQDWVVGVSYNENIFDRIIESFPTVGPISFSDLIAGPIPFTPFGVDTPTPSTFDTSEEVTSVFAEFVLRPSDRWSIVGGLRYDDIETIQDFSRNAQVSVLEESDLTFRLGATYTITDGVNVYASLAESFVPQTGVTFGGSSADPTTGISYEIGAKASLFNERLSVNAAIFDTRRENLAVPDLANSVLGGQQFVTLIGEQRNRGLELSGVFKPFEGLNVNFSYGHLDVDIVEGSEFLGQTTSPPGNTASIYITYQLQEGPLTGLVVGGGTTYFDDRQSSQSPTVTLPSVTFSDVSISYPITDNTTFSLNVLNVTDELYLRSAGFGAGFITGTNNFGPPRTFRFTLRSRF